MSKYTINVSFQTRVNKTMRTLEIAESFGLGLDEKEWTLYDNLELEVKQGDVVYITVSPFRQIRCAARAATPDEG